MVIPAAVRQKARLLPGTPLRIIVDDLSIRLIRDVPGPKLVRRGRRWVARPTARVLPEVDLARLVEEERNRWP